MYNYSIYVFISNNVCVILIKNKFVGMFDRNFTRNVW